MSDVKTPGTLSGHPQKVEDAAIRMLHGLPEDRLHAWRVLGWNAEVHEDGSVRFTFDVEPSGWELAS